MPSKESYITYFIVISTILIVIQYIVYRRFTRILRRDFPKRARLLVPITRAIFLVMNLPLVLLFFRKLTAFMTPVTNALLVPFTVWQGLMIVWMLVLTAVTLLEAGRMLFRNLSRRRP